MPSLPKLTPGAVFAQDFKVVRPLAEGGMGAVYVVEQLSTGKLRALKVMHPTYVADARLRERFAQEARIGGKVVSAHIVETVAAGVDVPTGTPWLVMELLEGEDLGRMLARRGALPPSEALELLGQLCDGLGAAHALGIVHRDLKPENLFIEVSRRRGVPFTLKVLDFGVARQLAMGSVSQSTMAVGTPLWMAPEQSDGRNLSPATDVWALGLIAFQMLTGKVYWLSAHQKGGVDLAAMLFELLGGPLDPPSVRAAHLGFPGTLPPGFDRWFARCVARDPAERFHQATEAGGWLSAAFDSAGPPPGAIAPTPVAGTAFAPVNIAPVSMASSAPTIAMDAVPGIPQGVAQLPVGLPMNPRNLPHHAPSVPPRRPWRWVMGFVLVPIVACLGAVALVVFGLWSNHGARTGTAPSPVVDASPVVAPPPEVPQAPSGPWDWDDRTTATWSGVASDQDARWSFVMTLRRNDDSVEGSVTWTVASPGSAGHGRLGESVVEHVGGHYHAEHRGLRLSGKDTDHPDTISNSEYHLHVGAEGQVRGEVTINGAWTPDVSGAVQP